MCHFTDKSPPRATPKSVFGLSSHDGQPSCLDVECQANKSDTAYLNQKTRSSQMGCPSIVGFVNDFAAGPCAERREDGTTDLLMKKANAPVGERHVDPAEVLAEELIEAAI